jgi:hypothetical protein
VVAKRAQGDAAHLRVFACRIVFGDVRRYLITQSLILRALPCYRRESRQLSPACLCSRLCLATRYRREFPARHSSAAATSRRLVACACALDTSATTATLGASLTC